MNSVELEIVNRSGLHARPAAALVELAASFASRVELSNISRGKGPVSAKSIVSVLGLGVRKGDRIRIAVEGADEESALNALRDLVASGLGEPSAGGDTR